ncbi:unnamed protein product, partial [Notodromas monacha]
MSEQQATTRKLETHELPNSCWNCKQKFSADDSAASVTAENGSNTLTATRIKPNSEPGYDKRNSVCSTATECEEVDLPPDAAWEMLERETLLDGDDSGGNILQKADPLQVTTVTSNAARRMKKEGTFNERRDSHTTADFMGNFPADADGVEETVLTDEDDDLLTQVSDEDTEFEEAEAIRDGKHNFAIKKKSRKRRNSDDEEEDDDDEEEENTWSSDVSVTGSTWAEEQDANTSEQPLRKAVDKWTSTLYCIAVVERWRRPLLLAQRNKLKNINIDDENENEAAEPVSEAEEILVDESENEETEETRNWHLTSSAYASSDLGSDIPAILNAFAAAGKHWKIQEVAPTDRVSSTTLAPPDNDQEIWTDTEDMEQPDDFQQSLDETESAAAEKEQELLPIADEPQVVYIGMEKSADILTTTSTCCASSSSSAPVDYLNVQGHGNEEQGLTEEEDLGVLSGNEDASVVLNLSEEPSLPADSVLTVLHVSQDLKIMRQSPDDDTVSAVGIADGRNKESSLMAAVSPSSSIMSLSSVGDQDEDKFRQSRGKRGQEKLKDDVNSSRGSPTAASANTPVNGAPQDGASGTATNAANNTDAGNKRKRRKNYRHHHRKHSGQGNEK